MDKDANHKDFKVLEYFKTSYIKIVCLLLHWTYVMHTLCDCGVVNLQIGKRHKVDLNID